MNHQEFEHLLSEYLDDELPSVKRAAVEHHLVVCSSCAVRLAELKNIRRGIKAGASVELPSSFPSRVSRAIRSQEEESSNWTLAEFMARRTVLALSIVVLLLLGLTSFNMNQEGISVERYLSGEVSDSTEARILFNGEEISKEDVLMAAVTKQ
ncbi:MAG TPA: zf-HC2 domain-containing protein [Bacteroidota bacterium]|nr:zf-HC2 domain-containing protein [Bacteroidota bacterium]